MPDSTRAHPQNEPPRQDSATASPQDSIGEQNSTDEDPNSKRYSTFLPLPGLSTPKGLNSQSKNRSAVPETGYSKDELAKSIDAEIKYIKDEAQKLSNYTTQIDSDIKDALKRLELLRMNEEGDFQSLVDLQKDVTKLKLQIPKQKGDNEVKDHRAVSLKFNQRDMPEKVMKQMPRLYDDDLFVKSPEFRDIEARFSQLSVELKLCLLCFSIFPGDEDIKKRLMVYWWMTEAFVPPIPRDEETKIQIKNGTKTAEEFADDYFEKLTKMGFIEPVNRKRSLSVAAYRMHPFITTVLMMLAKKANFFDFDNGEPTQNFSETFRACLVGKGLIDYEDLRKGNVKVEDLEKLHAVINVNEQILEFKKEWLLKMKNVNILYLGRWRASATYHIEVEDAEEKDFLDGLQNMIHLKFFSLQGVSRIMELPESISKLLNLRILDLRACHNLESIPEKIGLLKKLTHLDISECYMLEFMPKGIASLLELLVLKGFVVGVKSKHSCNLKDLAKLTKLIKLSIYTGLVEFPDHSDIEALQEFKMLRKLTIAWGGDALKVPSTKINTSMSNRKPEKGEKNKTNQGKQGGSATQAMSRKVPEPPKPDGRERKDKSIEMDQPDALKAQSSKTVETTKPDERVENGKEKTSENQGESSAASQSSRTEELSHEGERQKQTPTKKEGGLHNDQASKQDDGEEKQKMTTNTEIHEENATTQDQSNQGTLEVDCRTREKTQKATSKGTTTKADQGKMDKEKSTVFRRQRTFAKTLAPSQKQLEKLEKLDLKSFPKAATPEWLMPSNLKSLKKLYIRGGKFSDLGQYQNLEFGSGEQTKETWKVQVLRLKYLSELELDWRELQELFPDLVYLERVNCPKLSFFPCDGYGVWFNKVKSKSMQQN